MNCIYKDICNNYDITGVCEGLNTCLKKITCSPLYFNTDSVQSNFIKGFLSEQALPTYSSVRKNDYVVAGTRYVYGDKVIKITDKKQVYDDEKKEWKWVELDGSGYIGEDAVFEEIGKQPFGTHYIKHSEIFSSANQLYDSETHEKLGDFLRYYRDAKGINLMPLYNCNSARQTSAFTLLRSSGVREVVNKSCKVYMVPIKFNRTYTIAMDCSTDFSVAPALIINNKLLTVNITDVTPNLSQLLFTKENTIFSIGSSFKHPYTLEVSTKTLSLKLRKLVQQFEKQLYLLVQVDKACDSSLVVLEGDYTKPTRLNSIDTDKMSTNVFDYDPNTYFKTHDSITFYDQSETTPKDRQYIKYGDGDKLFSCIETHTVSKYDAVLWHTEKFQSVINVKENFLSKCVDKETLFAMDDDEMDELYYGKLFLLQMNDKVQHPISNNLLAYLLNNCITSEDIIANNVRKSEKALQSTAYNLNRKITGIWDIYLRDRLFMVSMNNTNANNLDELGYVTKNLESTLEKLNPGVEW